ncbi:50S ribosomal protein L28 [Anaerolineales bacterium HSG6]|nr:50S ribosomal protein L28 [Anaerolineales bacterium HSG6]MDM8531969.1 50S ribosomal protein L28 [Anaerolineales bacterium HSG25]
MARKCKITGKGPMAGNNVSHAQNRTKRRWLPNVQKRRIYVPEEDRWVRVRMSTRALRSVTRKGLMPYLREQGLTLKDIT